MQPLSADARTRLRRRACLTGKRDGLRNDPPHRHLQDLLTLGAALRCGHLIPPPVPLAPARWLRGGSAVGRRTQRLHLPVDAAPRATCQLAWRGACRVGDRTALSSGGPAASVTPSEATGATVEPLRSLHERPGLGLGGCTRWRSGRTSAQRSRSEPACSPSGPFTRSVKDRARDPRAREGRGPSTLRAQHAASGHAATPRKRCLGNPPGRATRNIGEANDQRPSGTNFQRASAASKGRGNHFVRDDRIPCRLASSRVNACTSSTVPPTARLASAFEPASKDAAATIAT